MKTLAANRTLPRFDFEVRTRSLKQTLLLASERDSHKLWYPRATGPALLNHAANSRSGTSDSRPGALHHTDRARLFVICLNIVEQHAEQDRSNSGTRYPTRAAGGGDRGRAVLQV